MKYPEVAFEPFFSWVCRPRIMYSPGLRSEVGFEMAQLGGTKVVIYTDKGLVDAGVAQMLIDAVGKSELELVGVFDSILQDARIDIINDGARFYREKGADCMIALGGGSVMDTAKAVNILIGGGEDDFTPLAAQAALWDGAKPLPPHIAFPTTAGTGCEITNAMVVLDVEAHTKLSVTHPYCNSDIAMLDPELMVKLPAKITAFTGMDALTHAVEGTTSHSAKPISDALCLHAIRLIFKYLPLAVKEPENIDARGHMLLASCIAGIGFVNSHDRRRACPGARPGWTIRDSPRSGQRDPAASCDGFQCFREARAVYDGCRCHGDPRGRERSRSLPEGRPCRRLKTSSKRSV